MNHPQFSAEQKKCLYCVETNCARDCPAGCSPADFLKAAQLKAPQDFQRAAAEVLSWNPLGEVCGLTCPDKFCQGKCNRGGLDAPIEIPCSQSFIVHEARRLGREPVFVPLPSNNKRVAVIGAGPAGISATAMLSQQGYSVDIFEATSIVGGQMAMIPTHRLPAAVMNADIDFCLKNCHAKDVKVNVHLNQKVNAEDLAPKYDHVVIANGQSVNRFPKEFEGIKNFILNPQQILVDHQNFKGKKIVVIGGGAVAVDVCAVLKQQGATPVVVYRRKINEMPVTKKELEELIECAEIITKSVVENVHQENGMLNIDIERVDIVGRGSDMKQVKSEEKLTLKGVSNIVLASGFSTEQNEEQINAILGKHKNVVYAKAYGTVVEAVSSGKSAAALILENKGQQKSSREHGHEVQLQGYDFTPADLKTQVFKTKVLPNPFVLSASPLTDGYHECKKALDAGWAGVILKTAFDGIPIHIPNHYMSRMGNESHANCDNVSGRSLDQVIADITKLKAEYPDRLIAGSTGGPVFGEDSFCKNGWQKNIGKLCTGGAELVELSLSCPQGGDSSEGSIAAQSVAQSCKIVRWALETPELTKKVPLLFKMTAACTSVETIIKAVQKVIEEYPEKNAGITMANSFPAVDIKQTVRPNRAYPYDAIVVGLGGAHVLPISNLSLTSLFNVQNLQISGNGGVVDYKSAADFIALGAGFVQICALAEERGVRIITELNSGLAHFMKEIKLDTIPKLYRSFHEPVLDFMNIPAPKSIASLIRADDCIGCGNCVDCPYLAIKFEGSGKITVDPRRCIGCTLCTRRCPGLCLEMRVRNENEPQPDI
ncbi:Sulfide_dehydrogenase [Hexamita inflata]|uniref:dihydropyrimidine dehydrogenase (NADP(+)) n=1 Tax=Hexamita inflata TaxID=28002 RepID=A0AA86QXB4_9EUKA|nr:Sulfide dehydrogenase [Hexamita inflata]